jgi:hypothetical protein
MAFGKISKQDLVDAGLDPDKLKEFQEKGVTKEELTAMETRIGSSIAETLKASLGELETKLRTPIKKEDVVVDDKDKPDEYTEMATDPVGFINKKVAQSVAFTAVTSTKQRMDYAWDRAKATLKGFKNVKLTEEIEAEWKQYKPENMARNADFDPDKLLLKIHNMVIGAHHEEIERDTAKRDGAFNMVASTSSGSGNTNAGGSGNDKKPDDLTDVEKKQAARYGMKPEEWAAQQKAMAEEETKVMAGV